MVKSTVVVLRGTRSRERTEITAREPRNTMANGFGRRSEDESPPSEAEREDSERAGVIEEDPAEARERTEEEDIDAKNPIQVRDGRRKRKKKEIERKKKNRKWMKEEGRRGGGGKG